jgi:hypothetical protein
MVDSDVVCCTRLIESELPPTSAISIIAEIAIDSNHPFIPLPGLNPNADQGPSGGGGDGGEGNSLRASLAGMMGMGGGGEKNDVYEMPEFCPACGHKCEEGALACIMCGALPCDEQVAGGIFGRPPPPTIDEYYRQPRFACGQLFVANVMTSLAVNSFFNPSLSELVHKMIKAEVEIIPLPREWEEKTYLEYFEKLLREDEVMPVAILRRGDAQKDGTKRPKGKKWSYVFTAPPGNDTTMKRGDKCICFGSAFKFTEEDLEALLPDSIDTPGLSRGVTPLPEQAVEEVEKPKPKRKPMPKMGPRAVAKAGKNNAVMMMR